MTHFWIDRQLLKKHSESPSRSHIGCSTLIKENTLQISIACCCVVTEEKLVKQIHESATRQAGGEEKIPLDFCNASRKKRLRHEKRGQLCSLCSCKWREQTQSKRRKQTWRKSQLNETRANDKESARAFR